ncbi:MAG: hypothetical protein JWQ49_6694 [Edaphobacter sp.]|nr:hypothetical protein [Edaphobacter sp.]
MTGRKSQVRVAPVVCYWIVGVWLICFLFCLCVPLYLRAFIPDLYKNVQLEVVDTFAPGLGVMLAFLFGRRTSMAASGTETHLGTLAVAVSMAYCGLFAYIMVQFALKYITAQELIDTYQTTRAAVSFLVTGMIAFYFGSARR